jgi:hypothetical protein
MPYGSRCRSAKEMDSTAATSLPPPPPKPDSFPPDKTKKVPLPVLGVEPGRPAPSTRMQSISPCRRTQALLFWGIPSSSSGAVAANSPSPIRLSTTLPRKGFPRRLIGPSEVPHSSLRKAAMFGPAPPTTISPADIAARIIEGLQHRTAASLALGQAGVAFDPPPRGTPPAKHAKQQPVSKPVRMQAFPPKTTSFKSWFRVYSGHEP